MTAAFEWTLVIEHCPSNCHEHTVETFDGKSGSFAAPNHDYPSHLRLVLKVTDSDGQSDTDSVDIYPKTGNIHVASDPAGIPLTVEPSHRHRRLDERHQRAIVGGPRRGDMGLRRLVG